MALLNFSGAGLSSRWGVIFLIRMCARRTWMTITRQGASRPPPLTLGISDVSSSSPRLVSSPPVKTHSNALIHQDTPLPKQHVSGLPPSIWAPTVPSGNGSPFAVAQPWPGGCRPHHAVALRTVASGLCMSGCGLVIGHTAGVVRRTIRCSSDCSAASHNLC